MRTIKKEKFLKYLERICACCGGKIKVLLYESKKYRGGHYFCKIKSDEYWECPKCYWGSKKKN